MIFFKESNVAIDDPNLELVYFAGLKYFHLDKNYQLGMKYLISAADRNHIESQIEVAKCYFMGEGVKKFKKISHSHIKNSIITFFI